MCNAASSLISRFDALDGDPLATMALRPDDFRASIEMVVGAEFGFPRERVALGLEGGYNLDAAVGMPAGLVAACAALLAPPAAERRMGRAGIPGFAHSPAEK